MANIVETFVTTDITQTLAMFDRLENEAKRAEGAFDRLGKRSSQSLGIMSKAITLFKSKMEDGVDYLTQRFEHGMKRGLQAAALSGTVYAGLTANNFMDFDRGATITATVALDDSPRAMGHLRSQVLDLSDKLGTSTRDIWDTEYDIFSSVMDRLKNNDDAVVLAEKIGKGARAAVANMKAFGSGVMGTMNAFKLNVQDVDHVTDLFFMTLADSANMTGEQLSSGWGKVMSSGRGVKATIEEIAAAVAYVTKNGGDAEENLTALDNLFNQLSRKDIADRAGSMGVKFFDEKGNRRAFIDVFGDFKKRYDSFKTDAQKTQFLDILFGGGGDIRAMRGLRSLFDNYEEMRQATIRYKEAVGVTEKAYAKFLASTGMNIEIIKTKIVNFGIRSLEAMNPYLNALARGEQDPRKMAAALEESVSRLSKVSPELASIANAAIRMISIFTGRDMDHTLSKLKTLAITIGLVYGAIKLANAAKWFREWKMAGKLGGEGILGGTTGVMNVNAGVVYVNGGAGLPGGVGVPPKTGGEASRLGKYSGLITFAKGASIPAAALITYGLMKSKGESDKYWAESIASTERLRYEATKHNVMGVSGTRNIYQAALDMRERKPFTGFMSVGTQQNHVTIKQDQPIILNGIEVGRVQNEYSPQPTIAAFPASGLSSEIPLTVPVSSGAGG